MITAVGPNGVTLADVYTGQTRDLEADAVVMVTARLPQDALYLELADKQLAGQLGSVRGIGDCWAPGTIAAAVWSGRRAAEEFDTTLTPNDEVPFRREVTELAPTRV